MTEHLLPDIIVVALILISIIISLVRGFVKELISVISWTLAAWLSIRYSQMLAEHITFTDIPALRIFLAFLIVFVTMIFLGAVVNFIIGQLVRKTPFSTADRILGMILGLARGVLVLSVLVLLGGSTPFPKEDWWKESYTITRLETVAIWMKGYLPPEFAKNFDFSHKK